MFSLPFLQPFQSARLRGAPDLPDATCALAPGSGRPNSYSERAGSYILAPNDLVDVKVFQEDDLESKVRISRNGPVTFAAHRRGPDRGQDSQEAARTIRDALAKGYLINPQVTVNVLNFAKYRVTVLGQVQKPGSYDFPNRES